MHLGCGCQGLRKTLGRRNQACGCGIPTAPKHHGVGPGETRSHELLVGLYPGREERHYIRAKAFSQRQFKVALEILFPAPSSLFLFNSKLAERKSQLETLKIHYAPPTLKTGFLGTANEKRGHLSTMIEAVLSRKRPGFPAGPRGIVPVLKPREMGCRSLLGAGKTEGGARVLFQRRKMWTWKTRLLCR